MKAIIDVESCEQCPFNRMENDINGIPVPYCHELDEFIDLEQYHKDENFIEPLCPLKENLVGGGWNGGNKW